MAVAVSPITQAIIQGARARGIDPNAATAVASQEGLSGAIGDGGHAFGPFQLNNAGGVITGKFAGETPGQIQQWAESPAGINYALDGIAKAAAGLHGSDAVNAIVTKFERPQNPQREIQGALGAYGKTTGGGELATPGPAAPIAHPTAAIGPSPIAAALKLLGFTAPPAAAASPLAPSLPAAPRTAIQPSLDVQPLPAARNTTVPAETLPFTGATQGVKPTLLSAVSQAAQAAGATAIKVTSGARSAEHNAAVGGVGHSNHLTGDAIDGYGLVNGQWVPLGQLLLKTASKFGLRSGDVAGFFNGGTDPVHVDDGANQR